MEYLTLQDVPHRHYHPVHTRNMASEEHDHDHDHEHDHDYHHHHDRHHHHRHHHDHHRHHRGSDTAGGLPSLAANHHMRNSPPFQPGEQRPAQNALPSFSQLLQNVREPSPPRTPSHRNESMENSPIGPPPHFDDVSWSDRKRRRVDTVADMHRPSNASEYPSYDARRTSGIAVDPALSSTFNSPRSSHPMSVHPTSPSHHHRPSLPYPPPPHNPAAHARHQSSPVPQGHAPSHPQYTPVLMPPYPYPHAPAHHGAPYDHRPSYYQDAHTAPLGHGYDNRVTNHAHYYPRPTYAQPVYANAYHHQAQLYNYTFQSTMGADNNSFNRKRRGNLPKEATGILKEWFASHRDSPYPTEDEKVTLCSQTQLTLNQVSNWFINARRRAPQKEQRDARESANEDA